MCAGAVSVVWVAAVSAEAPLAWLEGVARPLDRKAVVAEVVAAAEGRRLVLLGESTHGTHEYYTWRDSITRRLVETGRIRFIAVEGDWASIHQLNRYVKHKPGAAISARDALDAATRWPRWMWANEETAAMAEWLRKWNADRVPEERVGIYGMDVYAPGQAAKLLVEHADRYWPDDAERIGRMLAPMVESGKDHATYLRAHGAMADEVLGGYEQLMEVVRGARGRGIGEGEWFAAMQAAYVVVAAHRHFVALPRRGATSWNVRARHMHDTVGRLLEHYGEGAAGAVWAHNTHIGDSRATDMDARGEVNLGRLSREDFGADRVFAVGFATDRGTVVAGREWGGARSVMRIPPGVTSSLEFMLNARFADGAFFRLDAAPPGAEAQAVDHRAIGVIYRSESDLGHYVRTRLAARYDALIFLPETKALSPLRE